MSTNAMHVAKTGLNAQQVRMQIISNNLANVNTNGFKRDRANFESLLYQVIRSSGAQTSVDTELTSGFSVGTGVSIVNSNKLHSQGSIVSTDNSLDLAVDGGGFFQVLLPDGQIFNAHIHNHFGNQKLMQNYNPKRPRKLLLKKKEISKIKKKLLALGYTLVPLDIHYNSKGFAKVQIGISKGRKKEDKRQYKKEQDWKREKSKIFKKQNY